jgi:DnaJ-domain-containing protein 1
MAGDIIKKRWRDLTEIAQAAISNVTHTIGRGGNVGLLLAAIAVLGAIFLTAVVYAPVTILLMGLLYYEFRAMRTPAQRATYSQREIDELSNIEEKLKPISFRLSKIYEEGSHLKRNLDGTFHRGSRVGVKLNDEIDELIALEEGLNARANQLRQAVLDRLDEWKRVVSLQFAFRLTTASYAIFCFFVYVLDLYRIGSFSQASHSAFVRRYLMQVSGAYLGYGVLATALACAVILALGYKGSRLWLEGSELFSSAEDYYTDDHNTFKKDGDFVEWEGTPTGEAGASQVEPWYETLGVSPSASAQEINAAWREKMRKNHPDRVAELDPEFQTLAEDKSKRLNIAREEGLRRFED